MATAESATGSLPRWLLRTTKAAKEHSVVRAAWKGVRLLPFMRNLASSLKDAENSLQPVRDLEKIAALSLPRNANFFAGKAAAEEIEGMFSPFSMAIIDSLLSLQKGSHIGGNMLEFGVYRGRSAALLGRHLGPDERLVLVDIADYLDRRAIESFKASTDFLLTPTENFRSAYAEYRQRSHSFRFIHIDASHAYRATFTELQMADRLLSERGIIALDDFTNLSYSQNISAIFKYLHTARTDLTMFLATDEKAYLCRKSQREFYAAFVLDRMIAEMGSRDIDNLYLARTDMDLEHRAFYARKRLPEETGHFYGRDIYEGNFQRP
jgi:predicted O-methyltransferase YrrM